MSESTGTPGWVYAMTNEALPGLVKIGMTRREPEKRLADHNYGIAAFPDLPPFEFEFYARAKCCRTSESRAHVYFGDRREPPSLEWFRVGLDEVREYLEREVGPVTQAESWPWKPARKFKFYLQSRNDAGEKRIGGGRVYVWLYRHYAEICEKMDKPGFGWPEVAYEIGLSWRAEGMPIKAPPPAYVVRMWQRVERAVAKHGWDVAKWERGDEVGPGSDEGRSGNGAIEGQALTPLSVDAAKLRAFEEGVLRKWAGLVGTDQGVHGSGPDRSQRQPAQLPDNAADVVSRVQGCPLAELEPWEVRATLASADIWDAAALRGTAAPKGHQG